MATLDLGTQLSAAMTEFQRVVVERDVGLAAKVLHPNFALVLVQPEPAVVPRAQWLTMLPDYVVSRWIVEESRTDLDGGCAAVLQRVAMDAVVLGHDRSGVFVISDIWLHDGADWRIWRRHSSPQTAGSMPGSG